MLIHWLVALTWATCSVSSPFIRKAYPHFYDGQFFPAYAITVTLMVLAWPLFGGCFLTRLENRYRSRDCKIPYYGSFMGNYFQLWTGVRLPAWFVTGVQFVFLLVPFYVRFSDRLPSW